MKNQQSSTDAGDPVVSLQPLTFKKVQDDGHVAVFQTKIPDVRMPDVATPILTVSVASPDGDEEAAQELNEFLNEMQAGFALTGAKADEAQEDRSGSDPEPSNPPEEMPFNPAEEILFTFGPPGLSSTEGTVGMTAVVQTTVEQDIVEAPRVLRVRGSVLRNKSHRYVAPRMVSATVTSTGGSAQISPGGGIIKTGGSDTVYTRTITIKGITKCSYRLTGAVFTKVY
jgi:hypothetical protein